LLAAALMAGGVIAASTQSSSAASRPPKLQYQISTLPNGLTVVLSEDHSTPIVHLQLVYHVGSKNEKAGRTGFAHLFEHLMFKGSKNVQPEAHTSMLASVGGQSNAYTTDDETVFWETVPSQYLPLILWLEADRMASLRIDKDTFTNERDVVKEERRMRVDNQPYGRLNEIIYDQAFTVHPYKHATIGSMEDLEAASVDDVRDFYQTYYVPANATLVLVGDFDSAQALQLVSQYVGRVPKADRPVPRDIPQEPPQTKEKRVTLQQPWPLPAVVVAYHVTNDGNPDSYPLHIAAKVLSDGADLTHLPKSWSTRADGGRGVRQREPHRASESLLRGGDRAAGPVAGGSDQHPDRGARSAEERTDHRARAAAHQEPVRARLHPGPGIEPAEGRPALARRGDSQRHQDADGEFEIFQNITVADVQRVARTYFRPENRLVITIMPSGKAGAQ
jgi:zinc protease